MLINSLVRTKILLIFLIAIFITGSSLSASAQRRVIKGVIIDSKSLQPIMYAGIYVHTLGVGVGADDKGHFAFTTVYKGELKIRVSSTGYQTLEREIAADQDSIVIHLNASDYSLGDVVVTAREGVKGNSVSLIEREAMSHMQPSSLADLMQLLPGHSSSELDMSKASLISMRQAGSDINTALGTSFVVDGTVIDGDADMQSTHGVSSSAEMSQRLTTSKGVDMRSVSTDMVESVEVIRGIPSVKYGNLTAGVVKVELKSGHTPWEARAKTDLKNMLFSLGKGFALPGKGGALNLDLDYASYRTDPRTALTNYSRATLALRYRNNMRISSLTEFTYHLNFSYTGSFDDVKKDPDDLAKDDYLKNRFSSYKLAHRGSFRFKRSFFKFFNYSLSYTTTRDRIEQQKLISLGGTAPLTSLSTEEGVWETGYLPAEYPSKLVVDGRPMVFNANFDIQSEVKLGSSIHSLLYGLDYSYKSNRGKGELYDPMRPPYTSLASTRPRPFRDVPAMNNLALFIEDDMALNMGKSVLKLTAGVRAVSLLGVGRDYKINGKFYWEPRVNMKFKLPPFKLFSRSGSFTLKGGWGILHRAPTMSQLYPDRLYYDYVQLNYYSPNPEYRFANIQTYIEDPTNYKLEPAKNIKFEAGFVLAIGGVSLDVTIFMERMRNGFLPDARYILHNYKQYDASSVLDPQSRPSIDEFRYRDEIIATRQSRVENRAGVKKLGIEYTLDLGRIEAIYTRIRISGAWFKSNYSYNNKYSYSRPNNIINDRPYPYVGVYEYASGANATIERSQLNTNINLDTHIPILKMIFSTRVEIMWFQASQRERNSGMPVAYIDNSGVWHDFTPDMAKDPVMQLLTDKYNNYTFLKDKDAMALRVSLTLSKEIGRNIRLSCYLNNMLSYLPIYTNVRGVRVNRYARPYFGAELNFKF